MFRLNDYQVHRNPCAGVHDPFLFWDPHTKRYYCYSTDLYDPEPGLPHGIGIPVRSSPDLLHFRYEGMALSEAAIRQGRDNGSFPPTAAFWAPCMDYANGEYRLYYAATRAFGSSESRIWLAVSDSPLGPFENRGVAVDTWGTDNSLPNGIDPHILWEGERCWLVYGSFFGGIYLKALDPKTGLPADGSSRSLGVCLSRRGNWQTPDGPEGAAVVYVPETDWFYLFQSYGWLGETYDIRVGRSRRPEGPYLDRRGRSLEAQSLGEKLAGSYCFSAAAPEIGAEQEGWAWGGIRAPGHGMPFFAPCRQAWFFVHHIRDGAAVNRVLSKTGELVSYRRHYGMIRPMFFQEGWPVLGPEPFAGESLKPLRVSETLEWEILRHTEEGPDLKIAQRCLLDPSDPRLTGGLVYACRDYENGKQTLALTGVDDFGLAYWGKLVYNTSVIDFSKIPER